MTDTERILQYWELRPCFICAKRGLCAHREVEVAQAAIDAEDRRARAKSNIVPIRKRRTA